MSLFCVEAQGRQSKADGGNLFAWFDGLPLADVSHCKYVRIWTGEWEEAVPGHPRFLTTDAFLISDEDNKFRVVMRDWTVTEFIKQGETPGKEGFVGYRELSLPREVRALVKELGTKDEAASWEQANPAYYDRLSRTGQLFALARECSRRGHADLSSALLAKLPQWRRLMSNSRGALSLKEELDDDFAALLVWQTVRMFDDEAVSRSQLIARFQAIKKLCPTATYELRRVGEYLLTLQSMVSEESLHPTMTREVLDSLPALDRAKELVFRLRDECLLDADSGESWPYPDLAKSAESNGASDALIGLRLDAVPALIAVLDSEVFTRTVHTTNRRGGGIWIGSVGELAINALIEISGFDFYGQIPDSGMMKQPDRKAALREQVERWWKEVQEKGEKQVLIERTFGKGERPADFAELLLKRFPGEGEEAIINAVRAQTNPRQRSQLLQLLWKRNSPQCLELFSSELKSGATLGNRVAAAYALRYLDSQAGLNAMLSEWEKVRVSAHDLPPSSISPGDDPERAIHVVAFLASCTAPEAITALARNFDQLPAAWRLTILDLLGRRPAEGHDLDQPTSPATEAAIADLFVAALADQTPVNAAEMNWEPRAMAGDARVADYAGLALQRRWPEKYAFDIDASLATRVRALANCANIRRRELGQSEADLPPFPSTIRKFNAATVNTVAVVTWTDDSAKPSKAFAAAAHALRGRPLNPTAIVSLLTRFAGNPQPGVQGFKVRLSKCTDFTGVTMSLTLKPGTPTAPAANYSVLSANRSGSSGSSGGAARLKEYSSKKEWVQLFDALQTQLLGLPTEPFRVEAEVRRE